MFLDTVVLGTVLGIFLGVFGKCTMEIFKIEGFLVMN